MPCEPAPAASSSRTSSRALDVLTDREREVLALVGGGLSNEEIAAELFISVATARTHVSRAMTKLHARDRAELAIFTQGSTPSFMPSQRVRKDSQDLGRIVPTRSHQHLNRLTSNYSTSI